MTIRVRQIGESDREAWDGFVDRHAASSHYHAYAWRGFFREYFRKETYYLGAWESTTLVGLLPLVRQKSVFFGDYLVSLPFLNYAGILADADESAMALIGECASLAGKLGVSHAELREARSRPGLVAREDKVAMRLLLPESAEGLGKMIGSKLRSQIRRPSKEGATVRRGHLECLDDFYLVFARNMRDLGTPVYAKRMFSEVLQRFPDETEIVLVDLDGVTIAAGFLVHGRSCTEVPWASADRRFNKISANMLLYWEMLCAAIDRGAEVFDFGRSTVDSGPHRFKRQWGATEYPLTWNYWLREGEVMPNLSPDNPVYERAIRAWKKLPLPIANVLGPRLARNLP